MPKQSVAEKLDAALDADLERSFKMAQMVAPALDAIMDANARATIAKARTYHRHTCACGDYFICNQDRDCCPTEPEWTCPSCLYQQQDDFFRGGGAI